MIENYCVNNNSIPPGTPPMKIFDTRYNKVIGYTTNITKDRVYIHITDAFQHLLNTQEHRGIMFHHNYP